MIPYIKYELCYVVQNYKCDFDKTVWWLILRSYRLYEQLEEVKHQKSIRSRQEACAENRLKAKEFHKVKKLTKVHWIMMYLPPIEFDRIFFSPLFTENITEASCQAEVTEFECVSSFTFLYSFINKVFKLFSYW